MLITEYTTIEANVISNYKTALYCASEAFTASLCSYFVTGDIWKASEALHLPGNTMLSRDYWNISPPTMSGLLVLVANCLRGNCQQVLDFFSSKLLNTYCGLLYMALTNTLCLLVSRAMPRTDRAILVATSIVAGQIITSTIIPSLSTARVLSSALNFNIFNILWACNRYGSWQTGATILTVTLYVVIGASSQFDLAVLSAAFALASFLSSIKQKLVAGLTPLNLAASRGHAQVVKLLLDCGARPSQTVKDTNSAIYLAVKYVHHPTLNVLLQHYSSRENRLDDAPSTLQLAVLCSRIDIVHQLIERGADVNELSPRGFCALHTSSFAGNYEMTTYLLSHGADINVSSRDGVSPLLAAVCGGHQSVVLALLKHQADAQKATIDGVTPLHIACWVTNRQMMKLLLDAGACLTSKDRQGLTPSDYAAEIIGLNHWPTEPKPSVFCRPLDPKSILLRSTRDLVEETRETSLNLRRFDRLGFYLLRIAAPERAMRAYQWAKGPNSSLPWYFCHGCANTSWTNRVWICGSCPVTIAQPVLCDFCFSQVDSPPKLLGCTIRHDFVPIDHVDNRSPKSGDSEDGELDGNISQQAAQNSWLSEVLSSPIQPEKEDEVLQNLLSKY